MKNGYLSQYFESVAVKRLSAVEVNLTVSHQHEFNGSKELKQVINTNERTQFPTKFLWLEEQNEAIADDGTVTWYDARENHPKRSEYRLYFATNSVIGLAKTGDIMFIAKKTDGTLLIILVPSGSTIENQLYWLFGLSPLTGDKFESSQINENNDHEVDFATRFILEEIGIEVEEPETDILDNLLSGFNTTFPTTKEFSKFARENLQVKVNAIDDPDGALIAYMEWEEKLFKRLERHIVASRLSTGFSDGSEQDVDGFLQFSLSVQNRRKSRAGHAFENHLCNIFEINQVSYSNGMKTENKSKPDFIFPSIKQYHDLSFSGKYLTMLGAKTTCKDRWRQVLAEAARIPNKHILTLEPGISESQTEEMKSNNLQLVLPKNIHQTYTSNQQSWLIDFKEFIDLVKDKQRKGLS